MIDENDESAIEKAMAKLNSGNHSNRKEVVPQIEPEVHYSEFTEDVDTPQDQSGFVNDRIPPRQPPYHSPFLLEDHSGPGIDQVIASIWSRRGMLITLFLLFATILVIGNHKIFPDKYQATASVRVKAIGIDDDERTARAFSIVPSEVLSNRVLEKVITNLDLTKRDKIPLIESLLTKAGVKVNDKATDPSGIIKWLKDSVRIEQERIGAATAIFSISLTDRNPDGAAEIVNSIVDNYIAMRHSLEVDDSSEAVVFLAKKMKSAQKNLDHVTTNLSKFQMTNADYLIPATTIDEGIQTLRQEYTDAEYRVAEIGELKVRLRKLLKEEPRYITTAIAGQPNTLDGQLQSLRVQLANAKSKYKAGHPVITSLEKKIVVMKREVRSAPRGIASTRASNPEYLRLQHEIETIEAEQVVLKRRLPSIERTLEKLKTQISHAASAQSSLLTLQSEWDKVYTDYRTLREQFIQYQTRADAQSGDTGKDLTVLDYAKVPTLPISASRDKLMFVGLVGGLIIALGIVILTARIKKWEVPKVSENKRVSIVKHVLVSLIGIIWMVALLGFIVITPYI